MSDSRIEPPLGSGLLPLDSTTLEKVPESPGVFRLRSSGQRVMFVGAAGDEGLREAVRQMFDRSPIAGLAVVEFAATDDAAAAEGAAQQDIERLKPLYNEGFGRFRNSELSLPKKGHRIRKAMHNP